MSDTEDTHDMVIEMARRERKTIRCQVLAEFRMILQEMEA